MVERRDVGHEIGNSRGPGSGAGRIGRLGHCRTKDSDGASWWFTGVVVVLELVVMMIVMVVVLMLQGLHRLGS
jgi:hypothetical protein